MDFLGLKNLTMLDYICKDIERDTHQNIVLNSIPLDNQKTYELISKADTFGVFQLESQGMRNLLRKMKPSCFDDIVAAIALFRPGPMENIPAYLKRKDHLEPVTYPLPELEPILKSTYGIMIYQEQLMQVAQKMAGFSLGKADILRKATSKKETKLMLSMKEEFIEGCLKQGYTLEKAHEVFDLIEKFANYGFNKSHSVAYGYIAYQLAYLKANYPLYFFASILSNELSSETTKLHCIQAVSYTHLAQAFEEFCKNKTLDQIAKVEVEDYHGGKAPKTGTDLASKCTITIDDFLAAVDKAGKNAQAVDAAKIGIGEVMQNDAEKKQLDTTIALVATDDAGKIVYSKIDVAQIFKGVTDTKSERKEKYGMKETSAKNGKIKDGGEWYEQAQMCIRDRI